ncbi:hypothetical protein MNB_SM-3-186 [hydrothermal vent metagenome]|uniref:Uncharacterized protein n=1 Tax=hydrothermal vent metagenome TaxID=652676 RepID=A0A1W1D311_9ZZZZ
MIRIIFVFIFLLLLSGCASKHLHPKHQKKIALVEENYTILVALEAEKSHQYQFAYKAFMKLYKKTKNKEYLHKALQDQFFLKNYQQTLDIIADLPKKEQQDPFIVQLKAFALFHLKQYNKSLMYLNQLYKQNYDNKIIAKIATILYFYLDKKEEAIKRLQAHAQLNGCSEEICLKLVYFYAKANNIDALLHTYLKFYNLKKDKVVAQKIIQIYLYQQKYPQLIEFLEKSHANDKLLLSLYITKKDYKKASKLAHTLYLQTGDISYLGQNAIFEYESSPHKEDKKTLQKVITKLQDVIKQQPNTLYLNYLGYLLIDHNLDITKGIQYVKDALKQEPNSFYYLDSLAWGYYKEGKCNDAKIIMDKVIQLKGTNNKEVQKHIKQINQCIGE